MRAFFIWIFCGTILVQNFTILVYLLYVEEGMYYQ